VEELLRYDAPVQRTGRVVTEDVEIGGKAIPEGAIVVAGPRRRQPGSAHFPDPERLDVTRREKPPHRFGFGIHFCLGAPLARVEGQIAIGTLLRRLPRMELASAARSGASLPRCADSSPSRSGYESGSLQRHQADRSGRPG